MSAISLLDINRDGEDELVVGSDDFEIRVFKNEEVLTDTTESDRITGLAALSGTKVFANSAPWMSS